jgi:hypothetical protein
MWSVDSRQVILIDKPSPDAPTGLYAVDVAQAGAGETLLTDRVVEYTADLQAAMYPEGDMAVVERLDSGQTWEIATRGNSVALAPDKARVTWEDTAGAGPYDTRQTRVYVAELRDDANPESSLVLTVEGGGVVDWLPDSQHLLISARPSPTVEVRALSVFSLQDGSTVELARGERLSGITIAPGGAWLAYYASFSADENENGLWVVRTDGTARRKLDLFGSYQWRDGDRLLVIPMELGVASHVVWQVNAADGTATRLTDPAVTPFKIANGDWRVSPDGSQMVFVNAVDKALWLLAFNSP